MTPHEAVVCGGVAGICALMAWHYRRTAPRRAAAEIIRQRDAMLHSALEGLGDVCLLLGGEQKVIFANEETALLFPTGTTPLGRPIGEILPGDSIPAFLRRVASGTSRSEEQTFVVPLLRDGVLSERHLAVSAARVHLQGAEGPLHLRVIIRDETDRYETEQVRKDFVANASHELRTPLSIINGYLENMLDGVLTDAVQTQRALGTMQKHGERLARIVEDMLTISKFESAGEPGGLELNRTVFSCRECVEDVIGRLAPVIEAKQAHMDLRFPPGPADELHGDRFYWDQIFFNLIENALKQNQPGNLVIGVHFEHTEDALLITVRDNGVGIPRVDIPFIFKRFFRVAKHHSQEIKGTGLGLSIVRRAVEAHGGTIFADSTPGLVTVFTIRLPRVAG